MYVIPGLIAATWPETASIVALAALLLDQVPPVAPFDNVVVEPGHSDMVPPIAPGGGVTVTVVVA